ncbi:hypothetical protein M231_04758 [Tremella mesenterica]|uniref:Uncharacterized protein n=1 Tax=Tremella mesenterica TaxID=5217 RepID=A0A4Q1BK96_TREME|nr:hypothetical protein M231_04758 [Tremella mesenterica]
MTTYSPDNDENDIGTDTRLPLKFDSSFTTQQLEDALCGPISFSVRDEEDEVEDKDLWTKWTSLQTIPSGLLLSSYPVSQTLISPPPSPTSIKRSSTGFSLPKRLTFGRTDSMASLSSASASPTTPNMLRRFSGLSGYFGSQTQTQPSPLPSLPTGLEEGMPLEFDILTRFDPRFNVPPKLRKSLKHEGEDITKLTYDFWPRQPNVLSKETIIQENGLAGKGKADFSLEESGWTRAIVCTTVTGTLVPTNHNELSAVIDVFSMIRLRVSDGRAFEEDEIGKIPTVEDQLTLYRAVEEYTDGLSRVREDHESRKSRKKNRPSIYQRKNMCSLLENESDDNAQFARPAW